MTKGSIYVSSQEISLVLENRETVGKGLNRLKAEGKVPGVIHRPGKDSLVVVGNFVDITKAYKQAGKHHVIAVTVGTDKMLTIVKEIDYEPTKNNIRHIVLGTVKQNEKITTEVPIELVGEAPALKVALTLRQAMDTIEISALPKDLPDSIKVPVDALAEVGDKVTVADIKVPSGITLEADPEHPVVIVDAPHVQAEEPEESPAAAEAAAIVEMTSEEPATS